MCARPVVEKTNALASTCPTLPPLPAPKIRADCTPHHSTPHHAGAAGDDAAVAALAEGLAAGAPPDQQRDAAERLRDLLLDHPQVRQRECVCVVGQRLCLFG